MTNTGDDGLPLTRWEMAESHGYIARFSELIDSGEDIDGEARLIDALAPRGARILDAGAGMGRVGNTLQQRGHRVVAVEKDPELMAEMGRRYPSLPHLRSDLLALDPEMLRAAGLPDAYDVIALVGNVIVMAAPGTEGRMLDTLGALLVPGGRMVVGFHPVDAPGPTEDYPFEVFAADAAAAGLVLEHRFGTYDARPALDSYVVAVLTRPH